MLEMRRRLPAGTASPRSLRTVSLRCAAISDATNRTNPSETLDEMMTAEFSLLSMQPEWKSQPLGV